MEMSVISVDLSARWSEAQESDVVSPKFPEEYPCYLTESMCQYFQLDSTAVILMFWMGLQSIWVALIALSQLAYVARSITTNENINHWKYDYLNKEPSPEQSHAGLRRNRFHNPFDHGVYRNCINFWSDDGTIWKHSYSVLEAMRATAGKDGYVSVLPQ